MRLDRTGKRKNDAIFFRDIRQISLAWFPIEPGRTSVFETLVIAPDFGSNTPEIMGQGNGIQSVPFSVTGSIVNPNPSCNPASRKSSGNGWAVISTGTFWRGSGANHRHFLHLFAKYHGLRRMLAV